ncbi:hypothetical protein SISSUDRAFT_665812 [Sistotremastrum suecicum HHB10207 ss-3]|uniref:Uncharacterized protein n=1 Tax=Sistotremastrum suecicum HHB10207 ss-3 TaxID=1314776 RepID=A0A166E3J4_9AGAM|nr:hypothetical protein SISSUDRAFT_665812 [Sistotremastrum suecicum HHB10207 ss-3]
MVSRYSAGCRTSSNHESEIFVDGLGSLAQPRAFIEMHNFKILNDCNQTFGISGMEWASSSACIFGSPMSSDRRLWPMLRDCLQTQWIFGILIWCNDLITQEESEVVPDNGAILSRPSELEIGTESARDIECRGKGHFLALEEPTGAFYEVPPEPRPKQQRGPSDIRFQISACFGKCLRTLRAIRQTQDVSWTCLAVLSTLLNSRIRLLRSPMAGTICRRWDLDGHSEYPAWASGRALRLHP